MTTRAPGVDMAVALLRVLLGYRVVAALWVWLLAVIALVAGVAVDGWAVAGAVGLATLWAAATVATVARRPEALRAPAWLGADALVSVLLVGLSAAATRRGVAGGYPFSSVLFAVYGLGLPGGLVVATGLSLVTVLRFGVAAAVGPSLIYLFGAGVSAWAFTLLRRNEAQRRRLGERLADERAERLRSQERAETAAALHDSVLQTLALIQRNAGDAAAVRRLARTEERALRDWLSGRTRELGRVEGASLAEALKDIAAEAEAEHGLTVEVVTVGDAAVEESTSALLAAAREALRNVGRHAAVTAASVYAEVAGDHIEVFVRDRGGGFDPEAVPPDRRGIRESIIGRLERHGGTAHVTSAPGEGTEVTLRSRATGGDGAGQSRNQSSQP